MLEPIRIAIVGSPRAGKTTLAAHMGDLMRLPVLNSDDLMTLGWSAASAEVARLITHAPGIFEGVCVVRALRKLLISSDDRPVDQCVVLARPRVKLTPGQERMRVGCESILTTIEPELVRRGVDMVRNVEF